MYGKKILAMLVVCTMIISTMVILKELNVEFVEKAQAINIPGFNTWGISKTKLEYDASEEVNPVINTSTLAISTYYVYYPVYYRSGSTYNLTWRQKTTGGSPVTLHVTDNSSTASKTFNSSFVLNVTGIWILANKVHINAGRVVNASNLANTSLKWGWFWVNSSKDFDIDISDGGEEALYGLNETITITVTQDGNSVGCWIDIYNETNKKLVFHTYKSNGVLTFNGDWMNNFTFAGNYTVHAYRDKDTPEEGYSDKYPYFFNESYGKTGITAAYYTYSVCGPWDPPEVNGTKKTIRVKPGEPTTSIPDKNATMYWGCAGQVNISIKDYDGNNLSGMKVYVYNSNEENVTSYVKIGYNYTGYIHLNSSAWGKPNWGDNGTWYVYIWKDTNSDLRYNNSRCINREYAEEWNTTVEFTVESPPSIRWKWIDDDGVASTKDNDGVIPAVPAIANQPLQIKFQIINGTGGYYGAGASDPHKDKGKNITISGDALYLPTTLDKIPSGAVNYSGGTWTVKLIPTMNLNGGEITFTVNWEGCGSLTETLTVGGTELNGTIVSISPTEFLFDENVTFTVTVKNAVGTPFSNAEVYLHYVYDSNCTLIDSAHGGLIARKLGGGSPTGEYTFLFNTTQQKTNQTNAYSSIKAPRNISAYVKLYTGGSVTYMYGYALAKMKPRNELKVTVTPSTVMAGEKISKMYFNTTIVDSTGNKTGYPKDTDLKVRIYNSTGKDVTGSIGSLSSTSLDGKANKTVTSVYFTKPGTYTVYAYNNTYNSEGYNATLIVEAVDVSCDVSEFIWNVDKNISATFTVKYNGQPVNGTLRLFNITDAGTYNRTWVNYTSDPSNNYIDLTVTDGVATMHNITANNLETGRAQQNITFEFKPKTSSSAYAKANGMVPVKIADVTPSPRTLPYNKPAELRILVSGRGTGLEDVFVSIVVPGLSGQMNSTTDADGYVTFAFTPPTTGDIRIKIENRTSSTKVKVTAWSLYIDVDSQVNEGETLTITVRNGTATGSGVADVDVIFNRETKKTGSDGKVSFTAPSVTSDRVYTIVASKEGYAEDTTTVTVLNVKKLIIALSSNEVTAGSSFAVTIADDTGSPVVGATVTLDGKTYMSGVGGQATLTAPSKTGDYQITATFTGYKSADPVTITVKPGGVPGFELLTLIVALGVAFILLRRRR
ncbi:MAG: hypothetical protein QXS02_02310 [Candidatus Thermoplasmatota archaeon]